MSKTIAVLWFAGSACWLGALALLDRGGLQRIGARHPTSEPVAQGSPALSGFVGADRPLAGEEAGAACRITIRNLVVVLGSDSTRALLTAEPWRSSAR